MHALVVGAGTIGQATGIGLEKLSHTVTFADKNEDKLAYLQQNGHNTSTPEDIDLSDIDAVFVTVDAPTTDQGIDPTNILAATATIGAKLKEVDDNFPLIVFRSTQPPGTTRNTLIPILHQTSGRNVNEDFGVAYWPEYLRAASAQEDFDQPRIITIATPQLGDPSHRLAARVAIGMDTDIHWLPLEAAELQKYCSNIANAVKISTFNWFRMLARKLGIEETDIDHVFEICTQSSESLWNREYGIHNYGPYSGACLPKDVAALRIFAETAGLDTTLLKAVEAINREIAKGG